MGQHKIRADERAKQSNPKNYTCGVCKQVHKFNKEKPYICPETGEVEPVIDEEI